MLIIQLTGLSGAGKSTLAAATKQALEERGFAVEVIDADVYRKTLNKDLGFSAADRKENIRRLATVASGFSSKGIIAIIAAIHPFEESRHEIAERYGAKTVWIRCDLNILIKRDTKGLYRKALLPENHPQKITNLTGINDPYEEPKAADLVIDTGKEDVITASRQLLSFVLICLKDWQC